MNIKTFPPLYHRGKQGEIRQWSVWTEGNIIKTEYGVLNGEMIQSEKRAFGKNVGRKNETSDEQQAQAEAQSMWTFKKDRKYSETVEDASEPLLLPMLAKEYDPKKAAFPAFIQPKLDGVRCLAFWEGDRVKLISRAGKEWTVPSHIAEQVARILPKDSMFDGELYVHGQSCQTITSWVKKLREETLKVQYHIYDMPIYWGVEDDDFNGRYENLKVTFIAADELGISVPDLVIVDTVRVTDNSQIKPYETKVISEGYEGAILRSGECKYIFGYRNADLMKVKTFQDAEFVVEGVRDGVGKFEGCAVFLCKNDLNDLTFECTCAVPMEEKQRQFQNKHKYIGQRLTVKFFDRTDDNLPRFPVGKMFRDTKDLG
jgi:DNA ligase 1